MLTGNEPFAEFDLLEAAIGVRDQGWSPQIPEEAPKTIAKVMKACFETDAAKRPSFAQVVEMFD